MVIEVGERAPEFRLRRTFDDTRTLQELIEDGPLLLTFYVFDFGHV